MAKLFVLGTAFQHALAIQVPLGATSSAMWRDGPMVGSSGKMHCFAAETGSDRRKSLSLEDAKVSCSSDSSCNFLWSRDCDDKWAKCVVGVPVEKAGDESSCTMLKPADQPPIGQRKMKASSPARSLVLKSSKQSRDDSELVDWKLCDTTVHSNLGNMGPDAGEEGIRFSNVATVASGAIDLVVTNTTTYLAKSTDNNGEKDCFGLINVLSPSTVTLLFRFVRSGTDEAAEVSDSMFSVYDIDESKKGMQEAVTFDTAVTGYWLMPDSELETTGSTDGGLTFTSTVVGTGKDNPGDPETLSEEEENRAVTVEFGSLAEYLITFSAIGDSTSQVSGRNFMFAGKSDLTEDAEHSVCEGADCEVWADPHVSGFDNGAKGPISFIGSYMSTFDRQPVDVNAYETGDFWLLKNELVQIQSRYQLSAEFGGNRAAVGAVAVGGPFLDGSKLIIEPKNGKVTWNGKGLDDNSKFQLGTANGRVFIKTYYNATHDGGVAPSGVDAELPLGMFLKVRRYNTHLDIKITTKQLPGAVDGQCGNFNGDATDDSLEHIKSRMRKLTVASSELLFSS